LGADYWRREASRWRSLAIAAVIACAIMVLFMAGTAFSCRGAP
jgi:anti-sigma-K factor RskA